MDAAFVKFVEQHGGDAFQRVVLACTRKTLTEALTRLEGAVNAL